MKVISIRTAILAVFLLPLATIGQTFLGSMVGTITDPSGASVSDVKVTLTNIDTGDARTTLTSNTGEYQFLNLVPGDKYRLVAEKEGFSRMVREGITVTVQGAVRVDGALTLGTTAQTVEITAETPALDTETAAVSTVISSNTIEGLALNGRNVLNMIALTNGVVPQSGALGSPSGNSAGGSNTNFSGVSAYTIGGGASGQSAMFLDGAPLNTPGKPSGAGTPAANAVGLVPTQDSVQEFRVISNDVSAEFGKFSGGVVNLVSKSGTNLFHGSAWEELRNAVLNANSFLNNATGVQRPEYTQNIYGANFGGPVKKDKLFFFLTWENLNFALGAPTGTTVPTAAMRTGDFSAPGIPTIYNPFSVCGFYGNPACPVVNGSPVYTRQPFAGNIITPGLINPYAAYILQGFSLPNQPGLTNNYFTNQHIFGYQHQYNGRFDYNLSDKQRLYARYTYWSVWSAPGEGFPDAQNPAAIGASSQWQTHQAVLGDTYLLSPSSILSVRASFLRTTQGGFGADNPAPGQGAANLANFGPGWVSLLGQADSAVGPKTTIQNYSMSLFGYANNLYYNNVSAISGDLTKNIGRHTIKMGGEFRLGQVNNFTQNSPGSLSYTNGFTSQNPLSPGSTGYAMASFLLGLPASGTSTVSLPTANSEHYSALYVTDTFQMSRKLTLTAGLRWDLPLTWTERYNRIAIFEPNASNPLAQTTGLPLVGAVGYVDSSADAYRNVYAPHYKLFDPRIGLAYRVTPSTVVRLGYALVYPPNDNDQPNGNTVNSATTTFVSSLNGGITPANTEANPFPTGLIPAPGRNLAALLAATQGQAITLPVENSPFPYIQQWNVSIGRDFGHGIVVEAAYAGLKGTHLPLATNLNQLSDQYDSMGQALVSQVTNPFSGQITNGTLASSTLNSGQLLRVYPQYLNVTVNEYIDDSTYNSLQARFQKTFRNTGSTIMVNYTWSKMLDITAADVQDWTNIAASKALDPTNPASRLVISYVYDLPFGKGRSFFSDSPSVVNHIISGWGVNGVTTIQSGFPLAVSYTGTNILNSTFGAGLIRPNVIAGCDVNLPSSWAEKYASGKAFNTACFTAPSSFGFGDEPAVDPHLRGQGITNFDLAISRRFAIRERFNLMFRAEAYNLANNPRFAAPGTALGTSTFGTIGTGIPATQPRVLQMALRLNF